MSGDRKLFQHPWVGSSYGEWAAIQSGIRGKPSYRLAGATAADQNSQQKTIDEDDWTVRVVYEGASTALYYCCCDGLVFPAMLRPYIRTHLRLDSGASVSEGIQGSYKPRRSLSIQHSVI